MILVPNLRPRLSGNNFFGIVLLVLFAAGACTPRAKVLKPGADPQDEPDAPVVIAETVKTDEAPAVDAQQIALLLPFELNRSTGSRPTEGDVKRSALALDFYQGFELGLEKAVSTKGHFRLEVLDSRDNEEEVTRLARLDAIQNAQLVVGPVFPKGIAAFAAGAGLNGERVLQVSPLAATMPTEFNLPNLVSITSPITTHVKALASRIAEVYRVGDAVLLYRSDETSSQQFLPALKEELRLLNAGIAIYEVNGEAELAEHLRSGVHNLVVCGSTNRFRVVTVVNQLRTQLEDAGFRIKLFGHPNWARMQFSAETGLAQLQTVISSSYYVDKASQAVREFDQRYRSEFGVEPTEFAYKGYDVARFFGGLLTRYGDSYGQHLLDGTFEGLHNSFDFRYDSGWGYVNAAIHFLEFRNGAFVRSD